MKKTKRILAWIGIILLIAMYGSTLLFALIDHSKTQGFLKASIACTIFVPVLFYAYTMFYRFSHHDSGEDEDDENKF